MAYKKTDQLKKKKRLTRSQLNKKANRKLSKLWQKKGVTQCEICGSRFGLTNMHRHKRRYYYDKPNELLWDHNQVIRACLKCHMKYEYDKQATEELFNKLRGEDE